MTADEYQNTNKSLSSINNIGLKPTFAEISDWDSIFQPRVASNASYPG